jgi:ABC-2 type transport system ATP-binding protein
VAENIIELVNLTRRYEKFTAVDSLNLSIRKGEIFGLLGPNGAGKSTTILMIMGLTEPTEGSVTVCGINSTTNPIGVKKIVGYLPEDVGFYDDMTGLENLKYTAMLNGRSWSEATRLAEEMLTRVGLNDAVNKKAGKYSRGMRQRLGLADVLIKNPQIIILDEPTLGIDPKGIHEFLALIVSLSRKDGLTVLFSSHHLHYVQQVCDRVGLFVGGKLLAEGDIPTLSGKLFGGSPIVIEVGLENHRRPGVTEYTNDWMTKVLSSVNGVKSIYSDSNRFYIDCVEDITSSVARAVVNSGVGLCYLNTRKYGLDDIYNRYFEGGEQYD